MLAAADTVSLALAARVGTAAAGPEKPPVAQGSDSCTSPERKDSSRRNREDGKTRNRRKIGKSS